MKNDTNEDGAAMATERDMKMMMMMVVSCQAAQIDRNLRILGGFRRF